MVYSICYNWPDAGIEKSVGAKANSPEKAVEEYFDACDFYHYRHPDIEVWIEDSDGKDVTKELVEKYNFNGED